MRATWDDAAAAVAAVVDPITTRRLDGAVAAHIIDAVNHRDTAWAQSWWERDGLYTVADVADTHGIPDRVAALFAGAAMIATAKAEAPLTYDGVTDLALAAAAHYYRKETPCSVPATTSGPPETSPAVPAFSATRSLFPLAALAGSSRRRSSRRGSG